MVKPIMKDIFFMNQKSGPATKMIGIKKRIIVVNMGMFNMPMINPVITKKSGAYQTEDGCPSLEGVRSTTRYQEIEVEYFDASWKKRKQNYFGWIAQIIRKCSIAGTLLINTNI